MLERSSRGRLRLRSVAAGIALCLMAHKGKQVLAQGGVNVALGGSKLFLAKLTDAGKKQLRRSRANSASMPW